MDKRAISPGRIAVALVFALSCFGLLLFLWVSFSGSIPLQAKGYRVNLLLPSASGLPAQADVRISGVPVGKVASVGPDGNNTKAVLQIRSRYAPLRSDVQATVRRKTLLGEAYVELSPGSRTARSLTENATIPTSHVRP